MIGTRAKYRIRPHLREHLRQVQQHMAAEVNEIAALLREVVQAIMVEVEERRVDPGDAVQQFHERVLDSENIRFHCHDQVVQRRNCGVVQVRVVERINQSVQVADVADAREQLRFHRIEPVFSAFNF